MIADMQYTHSMTAMPQQTTELHRRDLPPLHSRSVRVAREGHLRRSWPSATGEFFRIYGDEPLVLDVEFNEDSPCTEARLCTNLFGEAGQWSEVAFTRSAPGRFTLSVLPPRCGIFLFKMKYSPDGGQTWYLDRGPFTKVIVDPAAARDIRLYTFIPSVSGHIGDWIAALDHIRNLGFNTVHLLPVTKMDASQSPYAAADLFSLDPAFLNPSDSRDGLDQFEDFVRAARQKGIRLCLDLVLNHIGITSEVAKRCPEWIGVDKHERDGLLRAGCWHMNNWIKWEDLCRINYDHPEPLMRRELWAYMKQYALFWGNYAAYTGGMIRLDNLHSSHPDFIEEMIRELRAAYPGLVIQAEFFSDSNTLLKAVARSELNLLLATPWEYPFAERLRKYLMYIHEIGQKLRFLVPISTHDTSAPAQLYGSAEAAVARYFTTALFGTGQTGIVQGTERGALARINFIANRVAPSFPTPHRFDAAIRRINQLLERHALFHEAGNIRFVDQGHGALMAAVRVCRKTPGERFLLVSNLDAGGSHSISLDLGSVVQAGQPCRLQEMMSETTVILNNKTFELTIEPCGVRAYRIEVA